MCSGRQPCERWISADMSLVAASTVRRGLGAAGDEAEQAPDRGARSPAARRVPPHRGVGHERRYERCRPRPRRRAGRPGRSARCRRRGCPEPSAFTVTRKPLAAVQYCTSAGPISAVCHHDRGAGGGSSGSGMPYGARSPRDHKAARVVRSEAWNVAAAWCSRRRTSLRRCCASVHGESVEPSVAGGRPAARWRPRSASACASSAAAAWERSALAITPSAVWTCSSRPRTVASYAWKASAAGPRHSVRDGWAAPPRLRLTESAVRGGGVKRGGRPAERARVRGPDAGHTLVELGRQEKWLAHVTGPGSVRSGGSRPPRSREPTQPSPWRGSAVPARCPAASGTSGPSRRPGR